MSSKFWIRAAATALVSLSLAATMAAQELDHGDHDRDDHGWHEHDRDEGHGHGHAYGHDEHGRDHDRDHFRYADHDRDLRGWYHDHYRHLPPGLAMRDHLPPGLGPRLIVNGFVPVEARGYMHPCPHEIEVMLPPPPPNFVHVVIGGNLVLYNRANFQIADVFHFSAN